MQTDNNSKETIRSHQAGNGENQSTNENVVAAHDAAEQDIEKDPDLGPAEEPGADLDEGELAQLDNNNDEVDI